MFITLNETFYIKGMSDYQVIPKFSYDMPKLAKAIKDLDGKVNSYI